MTNCAASCLIRVLYYWQVIIDEGQLNSNGEKPDGKYLYRVHNKRIDREYTKYYYCVFEAKMMLYSDIYFSIMMEFTENQEEWEKQD